MWDDTDPDEPVTVLVVDDDPDVLFATARVLSRAGFSTLEAATGKQCLELAAREMPDLILLDAILPDIHGLEVCQKLKSRPATAHIAVIMISSLKIESDDQSSGLEGGADDYIARPVENRELVARITAFLRFRGVEKKLAQHEHLLKTIVDGIPSELYLIDTSMSIQWINKATREYLQKTEAEIIGKKCHWMFMKSVYPCDGCPAIETIETGKSAQNIIEYPDRVFKQCKSEPMFNENNELTRVLKIETDVSAQKQAQDELAGHQEQLEELVNQRTSQLQQQVEKRKQSEKKLEQKNIALNVLLENRDENNKKISDTILASFERLVFPYHQKIRHCETRDEMIMFLKIIEKNILESLSPLNGTISNKYRQFTPTEVQVADLIKSGKSSKEISDFMNISERSVFFHRNNIRKKLGIQNTSTNLRAELLSE